MKKAIEAALNRFASRKSPDQANLYCFPELEWVNEETKTAQFRFRTYRWMENYGRVLHGGAIAIIVDNSMGLTTLGAADLYSGFTPTITMTIDYKKPVKSNCDVLVRTQVVKQTLHTAHIEAELFAADEPKKILVKSSGVYFTDAASRSL